MSIEIRTIDYAAADKRSWTAMANFLAELFGTGRNK